MTGERINKLPKWAQREIEDLTRERDSLRKALNSLREGAKSGPISLPAYGILPFNIDDIKSNKPFVLPGKRVMVEFGGVRLEVNCVDGVYGGRDELRFYVASTNDMHSHQVVAAWASSNSGTFEPLPRPDSTTNRAKTGSN